MVYGRVLFGVVTGSALISSVAVAQESRRVDFSAGAAVEHHSNVARTDEAAAQLRGITQEDTIFTPTAAVDILVPVGRQALFLTGSVGYSFYEKNDQLNRERVDLSGGARGRAGPCMVEFRGGYARGVAQVMDPQLANVENVLETEQLALDVICSRQTGLGLTGAVSQEWGSNELALYKANDYERTAYRAGVMYSRPTFGTATVFASRETSEYPNRIGGGGGYDVDSLGVSYERQLGARIQGVLSFSYSKVQETGVFAGEDSETTTYAGSLSYRASNRLRFRGEFDRSVNPSSAIGGGYDLNTSYRLSGEYDLGSRITLGLAGGQAEGEARGGVPIPGALRDSTVSSVVATARYKQSERVGFLLSVGRDERTANAPQYEYTDNYVGLSADVRF